MICLEVCGIPGTGKSFLISKLNCDIDIKFNFLNRQKYYNNRIIKIMILPIVLLFHRKTIIEVYRHEKPKNSLYHFIIDYAKVLQKSNKYKNHKLYSIIFLIYCATFDKSLLLILSLFGYTCILDEGVLQKAAGLLLRKPNINKGLIIKDLFSSKFYKTINIIIFPASKDQHSEMINKRKRKNNAINKWADQKYSYDELLDICISFFNLAIDKKPKESIKFINAYNQKTIESFYTLIANNIDNKEVLVLT